MRAAIVVKGSNACQGGDLLPRQGAQLWEIGQEGERHRWADPLHAPQEVLALPPQGALTKTLFQIPVQILKFLIQEGEDTVDARAYDRKGLPSSLLLGHTHLYHLTPPGDQGLQLAGLGIRERTGKDLGGLSEVGNDLGIDTVGLRELPQGTSKVSDLAWVDDNYRETRGAEDRHKRHLVAAGGLQNDEVRPCLQQLRTKSGQALFVGQRSPGFPGRSHRDIYPILGHINTDEYLRHRRSFPRPILARCGLMPRQLFGLSKEGTEWPS